MALKITTREVDGVTVAALDGRIVLGEESNALREKVKTLLASGQKKILLTITHEAAAQIKGLIANVRAGLSHIRAIAPQLDKAHSWTALVRYIIDAILAYQTRPNPPDWSP